MAPEVFVDILREALQMVILLVSAIILPSLFVGLIVSVFQAATSINEQTINFLPRLIVTLLALSWGGHWLTNQLMEFFFEMVHRIPEVVG
ncbi:flagellar biosynthesis protein FliQ [Bowmanella dokdonensis]|uniref:Flagellar biosynthetic protein FliQ n=1 Tax=Bowmanella dokdonensis TaxID=751969 RepID=A0A939DSC0_9ALTE|nr:flagellar biosynthesis protein FliQ [Bowmanella dokdonensis]MBN7827046.1 flagellar biosynthesis protein FliQ [Bowmanella dokdonensis]